MYHSLSFLDTVGGLKKLEWYTQGGRGFSVNQWLPHEKVSHYVFLQQTELKLWNLQLHESITRRLIAAANELQEVINAMDTAGREYIQLTIGLISLYSLIRFIHLPADL